MKSQGDDDVPFFSAQADAPPHFRPRLHRPDHRRLLPRGPKDDAVQSSAQSSADTPQSTIDGVAQSTIDELIELYPEMTEMPRERLVAAFSEYAAKVGMTTEDYLQVVIRETRENDEAMRRAVEEATGNAPAQSR